MEGELAHIGAGLAAIGSGAAAIGVGNVAGNYLGRRIAQPICSCITNSDTVYRYRIRRSFGDLLVPRRSAVDVRCLSAKTRFIHGDAVPYVGRCATRTAL